MMVTKIQLALKVWPVLTGQTFSANLLSPRAWLLGLQRLPRRPSQPSPTALISRLHNPIPLPVRASTPTRRLTVEAIYDL